MSWTFRLSDESARDPARAGGKGAGLARLVAAGLPVPAGFVIAPAAMRAVLGPEPDEPPAWSDAAVRAEVSRREAVLREAPIPSGLREEIAERLGELGGGDPEVAVAVRSSASDEDGRLRSAAGQHDTVLGVRGLEDVLAAVRRCWASVHGARAAIYRARTGGRPFAAEAAVVVQVMFPAGAAGVVFTGDPFDRRSRDLLIEAGATPSDVVGGDRPVDRWELARRGEAGEIVRRNATGATQLDDGTLLQLAVLALRAERMLGGPADVEWAWCAERGLALLQCRPITPARRRGRRPEGTVWTQRFSGERWTEPATPLGWSIVEPALKRFTWWPWASRLFLGGSGFARVHRGIPYFNVTIFRHLLVKTPWSPTPEFVLELFPPEEQEALRRRRWLLPNAGLVAAVLAEALLKGRWRGHRFLPFTNPRDWERLAPRLEREADAAPVRFARVEDGLQQLSTLRRALDRYVGVHVWSLLWANLCYQALGVFLERAGGRTLHALRPALVAGAGPENRTLRTNVAVWRLAGDAQRLGVEERLLAASDGAAALEELRDRGDEPARSFVARLDALLAEYGHRSRATWEVFSARWRDEPALVLEMVRGFLRGGIAADPWLREEERIEARARAEATLDARLRGPHPFLRWSLRNARVFSLLRENQRFVFDRLMLAIRETCHGTADLLVVAGKLQRREDVVFLEAGELHALATGGLSNVEAARRIAARRAEAARDAGTWTPTFLFDEETTPRSAEGWGRHALHGLGISPGRSTGRVRIARSVADLAGLREGEILVVKATDPGWTPWFATAGGLVTELGGLLSHGAVVAREYGLPAVANVANATAIFTDGEEITVDGDRGLVIPGPPSARDR